MILIDYSGISLSSFMVLSRQDDVGDIYDVNLLRHMILSTIKKYSKMFTKEYGNIVLCADGIKSWRKTIYPYYKANRKKGRDESPLNWDKIYVNINQIYSEIKENMPYYCIKIDHAEGDDIIGVLSTLPEKHVIVSNDKDMLQLYESDRVLVYSNVKDTIATTDNVDFYLFEHICRGDTGDGVPNILSEDDTLVDPNKRQKSLFAKKLLEYYNDKSLIPNMDNFNRNKKMIDLKEIPIDIQERIISEYNTYVVVPRNKILGYFMSKKLSKLLDNINDF
jgi:hypothetical protein